MSNSNKQYRITYAVMHEASYIHMSVGFVFGNDIIDALRNLKEKNNSPYYKQRGLVLRQLEGCWTEV